ncbi:MAG TPA: DUF3887 domain-containing protein [Papillibacter sp.]|jgi:hypothetical protein|nr:DUF3887 domain-containing protein [Papillibacter sp.]
MKKAAAALLCAALLLTAACSSQAFEFDEDAAVSAAKDVIDLVYVLDFDAIYGLFREDVRELVTAESLEAAIAPIMDQSGAFVEHKKAQAVAHNDKQFGEIIIVGVQTKYENETLTYTISFDRDFNLVGLYIQ